MKTRIIHLIIPIIHGLHLNSTWFAWVAILSIECGLLTPPVGLNVYAVKRAAKEAISLEDLFVGSFPFFVAMLISVVLLIAMPPLVTWRPGLIAPL